MHEGGKALQQAWRPLPGPGETFYKHFLPQGCNRTACAARCVIWRDQKHALKGHYGPADGQIWYHISSGTCQFFFGLRLGTTISACLDLRCRNETCLFAVLLQILNLARHWNEPGNHPGPAHFHGAGHLWSWHHPDGLCWCAYLLWLLHWQSHPIYKASFCYCLLIHATTALIDCTDWVPFCRE